MEITQDSYNISKTTLYIDEPMYKSVDSQGNIIRLKNSDALAQAFKQWVTSGKAEKIRSTTGGPLIPHLSKAMTNDRADKIKNSILRGVANEFSPALTITSIEVTADNKKNRWVIMVQGYSNSIEVGLNTTVIVSNQ